MGQELDSLNEKLIASGRLKSCGEEYGRLSNDEERFSYTLGLFEKYEITPRIETDGKNSEISCDYRSAGNELFLKGDIANRADGILELYTKSVAYAENKSRQLAFSYGNRSALLFRARLYEHCARDVERALALDCPENLRNKLSIRRANCLEALHGGSKKDDATLLAKDASSPPGEPRILFDEEHFAPKTPEDNPEIPGVSGALGIRYDRRFGRHVVAARRIRPGEVLAVQSGYASVLNPRKLYTHCSGCLRQTWSALPCETCPVAMFCDEACREKALGDGHDVECRVVEAMLKLGFNQQSIMSLRLAVRAVREAGGFPELRIKLESLDACQDPRSRGFTGAPRILDEKDYSSVYTLERNTEKRSIPDLFGRSFNAVYILYLLGALSNFLGRGSSRDIRALRGNPWSTLVGGLVTGHQQTIPSNVHGVTEMRGKREEERAACLVPFLSLLNHSCDGAVTRVHYGSKIVLYAVRVIEADEQVFDNYGKHYATEDLGSRRRALRKQYYFFCECRACVENWPLFHEIPSWRRDARRKDSRERLERAMEKFGDYLLVVKSGKVEDKLGMIDDLERMIETLENWARLPCRELNGVVETLKRIYCLLGSRFQSLSL